MRRGRLDVAEWLMATFHLTADDARTHDNQLLRIACVNDQLHIAQWLVKTF